MSSPQSVPVPAMTDQGATSEGTTVANNRATLNVPTPAGGARIVAVGGARGENLITNDEIAGPIDSSDEWITQRTGIKTRARAHRETTLLDLSVAAARDALGKAGLDGSQISTVILSTVTYFEQTPALATQVAEAIGASPAPAYDISAACAGYCYGIAQADALVRSGSAEYVLVIGAEKMSDFLDPADRTISFLLGDGAGATIIGPADHPHISPTVWGSDGSQSRMIYQTNSWLRYRDAELGFATLDTEPAEGSSLLTPTLRQQGPSVFKWVITTIPKIATQIVEKAGLTLADIDVFIPHQANMRITDQVVKMLGLREDVIIARDIAETGNTSAASIPLATERLYREGAIKGGEVALQIGFGAGLVYAGQVVILPSL